MLNRYTFRRNYECSKGDGVESVLIMKSYHKEKDGQDFVKPYGYKVKNYKKTIRGSRMDISEKVELNEKKSSR